MNKEYASSIIKNKIKYDSYYDNTLKNYLIHHIKLILLGVITLGFAYPWILCSSQHVKCKHTVVSGRRMKFIGDPKELIYHWILWWVLTFVTFGLYGIVVKLRFQQWVVANTILE